MSPREPLKISGRYKIREELLEVLGEAWGLGVEPGSGGHKGHGENSEGSRAFLKDTWTEGSPKRWIQGWSAWWLLKWHAHSYTSAS